MKELKVRLNFFEQVLGSNPSDKELYSRFIASNAPDAPTREQEIEEYGVDAIEERGKTVFNRLDDGTPFLYDYQVKGFFKGACKALNKVPGTLSSKIKAYKQQIDLRIFINERKIPFSVAGEVTDCQRPLRASTPKGEITALANSEAIPEGSSIEFTIKMLVDTDVNLVKEWLEYGQLNGLGQWRNSGKGRFTVEYLD